MVLGPGSAGAATVAPGQDHACIVGAPPPSIDWSALANPILSFPSVGVKDQALQWSGGAWHMLYSDMTETKIGTACPLQCGHLVESGPAALDVTACHRRQRRLARHRPFTLRDVHRHLPDPAGAGVPHE